MSRDVLIISTMEGAANCAQTIAAQLDIAVHVATNQQEALDALRTRGYDVVIVEHYLAEADPAWADQVWQRAGLAMPLQVNFSFSGSARLAREVRAALARRDGEHALARQAAAEEIENELKSPVTGLLLESELALLEPSVPAALAPKLRHLVELAGTIRERLRCASGTAA